MPYGGPLVALELLDADAGDDRPAALQATLAERLQRFRFSDHAERLDKLELTLRNDDYRLYDEPAFVAGQKWQVTWGWPGRMAPPRRMVVKRLRDERGALTVTAHCTLSLLNQHRRARFLPGVTDAEWVRTVAEEWGYVGSLAVIEPTIVRHDITQPRWWTDAQKLHQLARKNGFVFYVDGTGLHWHRRPTGRAPVRNLTYRTDPAQGSILEPPAFEVNLARAVTRVRVVSIDPVRKEVVEQTAGIDDEGHVALGREEELFDPDDPDQGRRGARLGGEEVLAGGLMSAEEALDRAAGHYRETAQGRYRCTVRIAGDPGLGAKCIVGLWGDLPTTLAGLYYVRECITEIEPGRYTQELALRKDARLEVPAARKRRPRARVNPTADAAAPTEDTLEPMLGTVVGADGTLQPAYIWTSDGGRTVEASSLLTDDEFDALSDWEKGELGVGRAVALPDQ